MKIYVVMHNDRWEEESVAVVACQDKEEANAIAGARNEVFRQESPHHRGDYVVEIDLI